jgi:hypothetical protein
MTDPTDEKESLKVRVFEYLNKDVELPREFEEKRKRDRRKPDVNNGYQKGEK